MKTALTIAGSDPTGGAGLQADLRVFTTLGLHGLSIVTALTSQNTVGVNAIESVSREMLVSQFETLLTDIKPDVIKTGMLYSSDAVEVTASMIARYSLRHLIVDPVTVSSSGKQLIENSAIEAVKTLLLPLSFAVTPNIHEAQTYTGITIDSPDSMKEAATAMMSIGSEIVIITGGHLEDRAADLFYDGKDFVWIEGKKHPGEFHGTGCMFSAAFGAFIAQGESPSEAAKKAKDFIANAIAGAYAPGQGMSFLNITKGVAN